VLQFEFAAELQAASIPPALHPSKNVVYTGTHDNDTTAGWYEKLSGTEQKALQNKLGAGDREIVWAMIRAALASPANTAIVPAQDLLELGSEARMNLPGIAKGNWGWRLQDGALTPKLAQGLRSLTAECGRLMDGNAIPTARFQQDNLTPQIAQRAYELYEQRGRQSGHTTEDWLQAEREIKQETRP